MRQLLARLDQIACTINIWLFAVAISLGILDFAIFVSKGFETLALAAPLTSQSPVQPEAPLHPSGKKKAIDPAQWPGGAAGIR